MSSAAVVIGALRVKIILMAPYMSQNKIVSAIEANNVKIFFCFCLGCFVAK